MVLDPNADGVGLKDGCIFIDPTNRTISGWVKSGSFCGIQGSEYVVYLLAAQFDQLLHSLRHLEERSKKRAFDLRERTMGCASYVTFNCTDHQRVAMKVWDFCSHVSIANAKLNLANRNSRLEGRLPCRKAGASKEWNHDLNQIQISGGSRQDTVIFYSALYHSLMLPSIFEDVNGQYIGMDNEVHTVAPGHHFLATFSGWDTYRTQAQLWGLSYIRMPPGDFCSIFPGHGPTIDPIQRRWRFSAVEFV